MKKEKKKVSISSNVSKITKGKVLSADFFLKHILTIISVLGIYFFMKSIDYTCQNQVTKIVSLKKELQNAKTDYVKYSSDYNSNIRETKMREFLIENKLNLTSPDEPPYKLN